MGGDGGGARVAEEREGGADRLITSSPFLT